MVCVVSSDKNSLFRKNSLSRVSSPEQLNEYVKTTNPGIVLIMVSVFSILFAGFVWIFNSNIPKYQDINGIVVSEGNNKILCSFVDIGISKKLQVGMEVRISPVYFPVEQYGYISGKISEIGDKLITPEYVTENFVHDDLFFETFPKYYRCVEVIITFESSPQDKISIDEIIDGSQCTSSVVIGNQRAIDIIMNK